MRLSELSGQVRNFVQMSGEEVSARVCQWRFSAERVIHVGFDGDLGQVSARQLGFNARRVQVKKYEASSALVCADHHLACLSPALS